MSGTIHVRPSKADDRDAITIVHLGAFGGEQGAAIVQLVNDLLDDKTAKPIVPLVADANDELVSHLLFTSESIEPVTIQVAGMILAPI